MTMEKGNILLIRILHYQKFINSDVNGFTKRHVDSYQARVPNALSATFRLIRLETSGRSRPKSAGTNSVPEMQTGQVTELREMPGN